MKRLTVAVGLVIALGMPTALSIHKEAVIRSGSLLLLPLAPVDPRSLMQGDYLTLRYAAARDASRGPLPSDGYLAMRVDGDGVGTFVRVADPRTPLGPNELLIRYRARNGQIRIGAESYLFQEGQAKELEGAKYGELRVSSGGESVLVGLRDTQRRPIGTRPTRW